MLRFYKENEMNNDSLDEKKYWVDMVTDNLQRDPIGSEE